MKQSRSKEKDTILKLKRLIVIVSSNNLMFSSTEESVICKRLRFSILIV